MLIFFFDILWFLKNKIFKITHFCVFFKPILSGEKIYKTYKYQIKLFVKVITFKKIIFIIYQTKINLVIQKETDRSFHSSLIIFNDNIRLLKKCF